MDDAEHAREPVQAGSQRRLDGVSPQKTPEKRHSGTNTAKTTTNCTEEKRRAGVLLQTPPESSTFERTWKTKSAVFHNLGDPYLQQKNPQKRPVAFQKRGRLEVTQNALHGCTKNILYALLVRSAGWRWGCPSPGGNGFVLALKPPAAQRNSVLWEIS